MQAGREAPPLTCSHLSSGRLRRLSLKRRRAATAAPLSSSDSSLRSVSREMRAGRLLRCSTSPAGQQRLSDFHVSGSRMA